MKTMRGLCLAFATMVVLALSVSVATAADVEPVPVVFDIGSDVSNAILPGAVAVEDTVGVEVNEKRMPALVSAFVVSPLSTAELPVEVGWRNLTS
jgi:hypothetical protein